MTATIPAAAFWPPAPPAPKKSPRRIALIVAAIVLAPIVLGTVLFGAFLAFRDSPFVAAILPPQEPWVDEAGTAVNTGLVLYLDYITQAATALDKERYNTASDYFQKAEAMANIIDEELSLLCLDSAAKPRCQEMRSLWQNLAYTANISWRCMIDLDSGYDSGDCDKAMRAMKTLANDTDAIMAILDSWGWGA